MSLAAEEVDRPVIGDGLQHTIQQLMCLAIIVDHLSERERAAMREALELLSARSGREVATAFVEWQRSGGVRLLPSGCMVVADDSAHCAAALDLVGDHRP